MKFFRFYNKKIILWHILLIFLFFSCRFDVPLKEMSQAKLAITRAVEVKAEKYASGELKSAKEKLFKTHDYVKSEDVDAARESAKESFNSANKAIFKSLPPLANDTLEEAKTIYKEANNAFAKKYAPEDFALAEKKIGKSESLFENGDYWDSYLKSVEASMHAINARDKALMNIAAMKKSIKRIRDEAVSLESIGGRDFAPDDMKTVDTNLESGSGLLAEKNVKEASGKILEADAALKRARLKTLKAVAAERIKAAMELLEKCNKSKYRKSFIGDIEKAAPLINISKDLFEKESYSESSLKSEEAIIILNSVTIAIEKEVEEIRIEEESEEVDVKHYVVKFNPNKRDCLWRIAMHTYKDARLWPLIYMANRDKIKDPDLIFPGQKLIIPEIPAKFEKTEVEEQEKETDATDAIEEIQTEKDKKGETEKEEVEKLDSKEGDTISPINEKRDEMIDGEKKIDEEKVTEPLKEILSTDAKDTKELEKESVSKEIEIEEKKEGITKETIEPLNKISDDLNVDDKSVNKEEEKCTDTDESNDEGLNDNIKRDNNAEAEDGGDALESLDEIPASKKSDASSKKGDSESGDFNKEGNIVWDDDATEENKAFETLDEE